MRSRIPPPWTALGREIDQKRLEPVYETLARVKQELPGPVTLLGFCGAPWTLATYMIAGGGTVDQFPARSFAYRFPEAFSKLIDILVDASTSYLIRQFVAGADAVQIFDTWAGILPADEFRKWCIEPTARIVDASAKRNSRRENHRLSSRRRDRARAPISMPSRSMRSDLDWTMELGFARNEIQPRRPIQGNLDPLVLLVGGTALDRSIDAILEAFSGGPFIFNLGHGVLPDTPIAHVERLVARVRGASRQN